MRAQFFRTKYLTGSRIQMRYLTLLMVSIVIPVVFISSCLYFLIFTLMAEQVGIPEYIANNIAPVVEKINTILLYGVPPLFIILIIWGIVVSHRFAGPLERLEKELDDMAEKGDVRGRIMLRKRDDVKPVADAINRLLDRLEEGKK